MTLTIVVENTAHPDRPELRADHGLAVHIDTGEYRLLYDFGPEGPLKTNAEALGIDLGTVDLAVLSHGHHDHAGGLADFFAHNSTASVIHGKGALAPRWAIKKGQPKLVGVETGVSAQNTGRFTPIGGRLNPAPGVTLLTAAPGHHPRPAGNATLLAGPEGDRLPDTFDDEITAVIEGNTGIVVVSGCSHRGILNIVEQVKTFCSECPVAAVIGGFHLIDEKETDESRQAVAEGLRRALPESIFYLGHCTDPDAVQTIEALLGERTRRLHTGLVIEI